MPARFHGAGLLLAALLAAAPAAAGTETVRAEAPTTALTGLTVPLELTAPPLLPDGAVRVEVRDAGGALLHAERLEAGATTRVELHLPRGRHELRVTRQGQPAPDATLSVRVIPAWLSVLPPAFAILLALVFRHVVPSLLAGVWIGAWIHGGALLPSVLRTIDRYLLNALADRGHLSILVFSLLLGGMVGVMSRSGGTAGLVDALRPYATSSRRGQLVTWVLGLLIFFDDYANTLVVGNTMRPVTDRLRISREKLAYIVDSTAAPVAAIFLISTWIGYEVSLIAEALEAVGSDRNAYTVFLEAIPYNFYPILALGFGLMVAWSGRDFGPMLAAERRAAGGRLLAETAVPLADFDSAGLEPIEGKPRRWINAVAPVLVVVLVTFASLWIGGRGALAAEGRAEAGLGLLDLGMKGIGTVLGAGDAYVSLLYAAFSGLVSAILLALVQRILRLGHALDAMVGGFKSMVMAFVILTLAWAISDVCKDLNTSGFMVSALADTLHPGLLPTLVFLLAAVTAFATGSSWGTMGILIPLAVPTAYGVAQSAGYDAASSQGVLLAAVASVLAGGIFGDHCSPISDTTVLSSMSSGCDHVDHVRTQLPYALVVAGVAVALGSLPTGFGVSALVCMPVALVALALLLRLFGRTSPGPPS